MAGGPERGKLVPLQSGDRRVRRGDSAGLVFLANVTLKHARLIAGVALGTALLTGVLVFLLPRYYSAEGAFVVDQRNPLRLPSGLTALAGQFGFGLPTDAQESPQFYAEVLRSKELTDAILLSRFAIDGDSARLLSLLKVRGKSLADSLYRGRRRMAKLLDVRVDQRSGLVRIYFTSRNPKLSADVVNRYFELLNAYNLETRQSRARRRREFVEDRVTAANLELRDAEERLRNFVERNRLWQQSPELQLQYERLEREVQVAQEVYLTLKRTYEEARVEEVNDTPVLTVVDSAIAPVRHTRPRRGTSLALALIFGTALGVAGALFREYLARLRREGSEELEELESQLRRLTLVRGKRDG